MVYVRISTTFDFYGYSRYVLLGTLFLGIFLIVWKLILWNFTLLILTDQRVVCQIQEGIFSKKIIEILYKDIKELSFSKKGLGGAVFNYGNLMLNTAADSTHIFEHIPGPDQVVALISKVR